MKKVISLLLALALTTSVFTACSNNEVKEPDQEVSNQEPTNQEDDNKEIEKTEDNKEKVLSYYLGDTPEILNPHTTASNYELIKDMTATLYRQIYDEKTDSSIYVPALADGNPICEDEETHKIWTIKIKDGYKFVDGTPIDAYTVEYSIKMLNDPKLANRNTDASSYVNGEKYLSGECEWSEVGFKAIDKNTIQVTYADHMEPESAKDVRMKFDFVGTGVVHPEKYAACISEDGTSCSYGSDLDSFVASGLYTPSKLIPGQFLELTRRDEEEEAPLADIYTPDKVEYYCVADANTAVQLFEQGKIDVVIANQPAYDDYPNSYFTYTKDNMGLYVNGISPKEEALKDVNLRYALYWGLDRDKVVKAVYPTADPCAYQYLPYATMPDPADKENKVLLYRDTPEAKAIRIDGHEVTKSGFDEELAKEYFDKAYEANGSKKIVINSIYSDTSEVSKTWAEAIQSNYQKLFGEDKIEIVLQATPGSIMYEEISRKKMNYDMALTCGWNMDPTAPWQNTNWVYSGPYTYNTQYCSISDSELSKEWDELFYKCDMYEYRWDAQKKLESAARMEEILLNDCSYIPGYVRGYRYFFSQKVTPVTDKADPTLIFYLMQIKFN